MSHTRPRILRQQKGAALLTTVVILGMLAAMAGAYAANVRAHLRLRAATSTERVGFYTAEGGLNVGVKRFANIFSAGGVPQGSDFEQQLALGDRTADVSLAPVSGCSPCAPTVVPQGELFGGLNTIPYQYTVQSRSLNHAGDTEAHVAGQFDINTIPIFQFLAFIDAHLFIMPLPNMTLHGRLHSNHDLYLQPDNTLKVEDQRPAIPDVQVTASGSIYRGGRKYDSGWRCSGTVTIDKLEDKVSPFNDLDPKTLVCGSGSGPVSDATLAAWKGSIKQDVANLVTPDVGIINRGTGEYWGRADLRIVLRLDAPKASINFGAADLCPAGEGICSTAYGSACASDAQCGAGMICIPAGSPGAGTCTAFTGVSCPTNACDAGSVCMRLSPPLSAIEVQTKDGTQDVAKTRALWRFMCERRGALFYTDVPLNPPTPPNGDWSFVGNRLNYSPAFASDAAADNRVYRRVGEDTNGDGIIDSKDQNDDVCPPGTPWYETPRCARGGAPNPGPWFRDLDYRRGAFWNHREQQYMYLLNLNLRALIEWNAYNGDPLFPHNDTTDGGIVVFLSVAGPSATAAVNNYGARLFDSADLDARNTTFLPGVPDPTGVTVVSDQGVIIQGNYNYKDKFPAAILSDAQWMLSQGWEVPMKTTGACTAGTSGCYPNDQKSVFDLSTNIRDVPGSDSPGGTSAGSFSTSTALGVNAALLFGLGPSTRNPDWYNGGLENFPRFLESWDNRTMNYRGSFVSLGGAQHKLANWQCGSGDSCLDGVYDPPTRAYDYDADFNTAEKLPPMTPKIVYVQQLLYTRIFN
jgi:hypothetical protein